MPSSMTTRISRCTVKPEQKASIKRLKLSVSDLPMLSCQYIQKGVLFTKPPLQIDSLVSLLKLGLSKTLTHFPALAGRLTTDPHGYVYIKCNDAGVDFVHANAAHVSLADVLTPGDVPDSFKEFFVFDGVICYDGHSKPIAAVQVTELADGVFIGCAVNHAVTDGTSFWNFFNTFAEVSRGVTSISRVPDFRRNFVRDSPAVLRFDDGTPKVTFDVNAPLRERIFHFSRQSILKLKLRANNSLPLSRKRQDNMLLSDRYHSDGKMTSVLESLLKNAVTKSPEVDTNPAVQISSFQSLCAQLWRSITRARNLVASTPTTFRMAVNCRHRLEPKIDPYYFGNAIQSIPTVAPSGELLARDLQWSAQMLNKNVAAHDNTTVRRNVEAWEKNPRCFPLGNFDGAMITMGSSPRFPMYNNDFGWGRPIAVRSGRSNKFDGKVSAFPGRDGDGSVDLEVCLAPETMKGLENDTEFMQYASAETY